MKKQWITFDLDGTLMQNPFVDWVFPEIEAQIRSKHPSKEFEVKSKLVDEHNRRMGENKIVDAYDWDDIVNQLICDEGLSIEIDIEELVQKHSTTDKVYLLEHSILDVLKGLKDRGYMLAAVTNGFRKYQLPVMKALGLVEYFDDIITPDLVGVGKPDTGMFKHLSEDGEIIAHIGDRVDHDVHVGKVLGVKTILINRKLSDELQALDPIERTAHILGKKLVEEKFVREIGNSDLGDSLMYLPDAIICTLDELLVSLEPMK
jgi:putative hydrolase of the HAD superfamily